MDAETFRTVMGFFGVVIVAGIGYLGIIAQRNYSSTKAVRSQVENNHFDQDGKPINMREESDERHYGLRDLLEQVLVRVGNLEDLHKSTRSDIGGIRSELREHARKITDIGSTQSREEIRVIVQEVIKNENNQH